MSSLSSIENANTMTPGEGLPGQAVSLTGIRSLRPGCPSNLWTDRHALLESVIHKGVSAEGSRAERSVPAVSSAHPSGRLQGTEATFATCRDVTRAAFRLAAPHPTFERLMIVIDGPQRCLVTAEGLGIFSLPCLCAHRSLSKTRSDD